MARKDKAANKQQELIEDEEFSSEDIEIYKPTDGDMVDLEVDEEAYNILEYIDCEWPSLSVDNLGTKVYAGTFPDESCSHSPELVSLDLSNTDFSRLVFNKSTIKQQINKIRVSKSFIYGMSDNFVNKFSPSGKMIAEVKGSFGFAIYVTEKHVVAGTSNGLIKVFNLDLKLIKEFKASDLSVECVCTDDKVIIAGSTDHTVRIFDFDGNMLKQIDNDCDINAVDIKNEIIVFGDDKGMLFKYDLKSEKQECIKWHCSPISFIRWRDDDIFASGSDEQLCLWDITLEEEYEEGSDIPKNLLFVHQGEKFFKDCCFVHNMVVSTSENGICVFEPVSFTAE